MRVSKAKKNVRKQSTKLKKNKKPLWKIKYRKMILRSKYWLKLSKKRISLSMRRYRKPLFIGLTVTGILLLLFWYFPRQNYYHVPSSQGSNNNNNNNNNHYTPTYKSSYHQEIKEKRLDSSYYQNVPSEKGTSHTQHYSSSFSNNEYHGK